MFLVLDCEMVWYSVLQYSFETLLKVARWTGKVIGKNGLGETGPF